MALPQSHTVPTAGATIHEDITATMAISNEKPSDPPPTLTTIPTEVRLRILREVVKCQYPLRFMTRRWAREEEFQKWRCRVKMPILLCNKQLHYEALPEFFKQNIIAFYPSDLRNTLPPYAFVLIKHLKIKLNEDVLEDYWRGRKRGYIQLQYFQQVKTLTLRCSDYAACIVAQPTDDFEPEDFCGMYDISVSEIVVEGSRAEEVMDNIKMLFNTSKVGQFRRACDYGSW